jgi:hypothetical protein
MKIIANINRYTNDSTPFSFFGYMKGEIRDICQSHIKFCCEDMERAYGEFIIFGEHDSLLNKNYNVNILNCYPYSEGAVWEIMPIHYCPFCTCEIIVELIDEY